MEDLLDVGGTKSDLVFFHGCDLESELHGPTDQFNFMHVYEQDSTDYSSVFYKRRDESRLCSS